MRTYIRVNGKTKDREDLELIEQDMDGVYMETIGVDDVITEPNAEIIRVKNCGEIGFVNFDMNEVNEIKDTRFSEPIHNSVHLKNIQVSEQEGQNIYIKFKDGHDITVKGNLDRAYDYQ